MGRSPEAKKSAPAPPKGLRGPFFNFGAAQPCFATIFVFYFFLMFFGIFAKVYPSIFMIWSKKNFGGLFFNFFTFYLVKWNPLGLTPRAQKHTLPPPRGYPEVPKTQKKFIFFLLQSFIE